MEKPRWGAPFRAKRRELLPDRKRLKRIQGIGDQPPKSAVRLARTETCVEKQLGQDCCLHGPITSFAEEDDSCLRRVTTCWRWF